MSGSAAITPAISKPKMKPRGNNTPENIRRMNDDIEKNPPDAPSPEVLERYIRGAGQPPRYKTAEELQAAILDYFRQSMAIVYDKETGEHRGYSWIKRVSLGDLAIHLGMYVQDLWAYGQRDEYSETVKKAKNIVENYYEKVLQENRNPAGICFILKNGFGWRDVQDIKVEPVSPLREAKTDEEIDAIREKYLPPAED